MRERVENANLRGKGKDGGYLVRFRGLFESAKENRIHLIKKSALCPSLLSSSMN